MPTTAAKRYTHRFTIVMTIYCLMIGANVAISRILEPGAVVLATMAVLTALPIIAMLGVLGIYLKEETDEFVRDRIVVSMLIGLGFLLSLTSILGFLQFEDLVGDLPVFLAFPIWCGAWGVTQGILAWRDKRSDGAA